MIINKLLIRYRKWKIRQEVAKENLIKCSETAHKISQNRKSWNRYYPRSLQEMCQGSLSSSIRNYQKQREKEDKALIAHREVMINLKKLEKEREKKWLN